MILLSKKDNSPKKATEMKKNTTKKYYDITFLQYYTPSMGGYMGYAVEHTVDKNKIRNIVKNVIQNGYRNNFLFYKTNEVKIERHDLIEINGRNFISQNTEFLGEYRVIYPNEGFDLDCENKNVIDLNLNLIQKAKQR